MPCCNPLNCIPEPMRKKLATGALALSLVAGIGAPLFYIYAKVSAPHVATDAEEPHGPSRGWSHEGVFGTYDRAAVQRGFQVYKEVCAACHSLNYVSYRDLADIGFNKEEVKALAAEHEVPAEPDDNGDIKPRKALPSDHFVAPFANNNAAKAANGGALPPDLSLMVKARHGHEDYVYSLLTGFGQTPPAEEKIAAGMNYNPYFQGHQIAMPQPLRDDAVTYTDGTKATTSQEAEDVVTFLAWTAEPKMEARKETGAKVIIFLSVMAFILYNVKRRIWKKLH